MKIEQLNYTYDVDPNSDTAAASILKFVGKHKQVLEIGAGPGSITRALQDINQCTLTAIEIYADYLAKLNEFCPNVINADLNDPRWCEKVAKNQKFDVVVAADVLEHLYDPLMCLQSMATLLNNDGSIVISLPHMGHAVIFACLWDGNFEYGNWGLLDRTHIRFFGIENIQNLIEDAHLKIIDLDFIIRSPDQTEFAARWSQLSQSFKREILSNKFSYVYQIVLHAVPKAARYESFQIHEFPIPPINILPADIPTRHFHLVDYIRNIVRAALWQE